MQVTKENRIPNPTNKVAKRTFSPYTSATTAEEISAGIAASKMAIRGMSPLMPNAKTSNKMRDGAIKSLYNKPILRGGNSLFQSPMRSCNPIEKSAIGATVAANLSKKGAKGAILTQ